MISFAYRAFSAVVREKSFYQAAQLLDVTPSAISHAINQLEKFLGFAVMIRNRSGVKLTSEGEAILPIIQDILNNQSRLEQAADDIIGVREGSIRIGAFSSVCINWLPQIIRSFNQQFPKIHINVTQLPFSDVSRETHFGNIDLGFTCNPIVENVIKVPLVKDQIYCVTPKNFHPQNGKSVTKHDLTHQTFMLQKSDYDGDTKKVLDQFHVTPRSIQFSIDDQSVIAMVESGLALGILPKLALSKINDNVNIYPFEHHYYRTIYLVMNPIQVKTPVARRMVDHIQTFIKQQYPNQINE